VTLARNNKCAAKTPRLGLVSRDCDVCSLRRFSLHRLAYQQCSIIAVILFAIPESGLPFSSVENHVALQVRDSSFNAVVVKTQVDRYSLQFAANRLSSAENASRRYAHSVLAKKCCHCRHVLAVIGVSKLSLHFFEQLAAGTWFDRPRWVKLRRTQYEQMSSGLPLKADIAQCSRHDISQRCQVQTLSALQLSART